MCPTEEITEHKALPKSPQLTKPCDKNGFNIVIHKNATVIPLNLDTIWIPSNRSVKCKPKTRSINSVTFSFPFTECGTQSVVCESLKRYAGFKDSADQCIKNKYRLYLSGDEQQHYLLDQHWCKKSPSPLYNKNSSLSV